MRITRIRWEVAGTAGNARDRAGIVGMTQEKVGKAGNFGKSGKCRKLWEHEETSWNVLEQTGTKGNSAENPGYRRNVREQAGVYWKLGDTREKVEKRKNGHAGKREISRERTGGVGKKRE